MICLFSTLERYQSLPGFRHRRFWQTQTIDDSLSLKAGFVATQRGGLRVGEPLDLVVLSAGCGGLGARCSDCVLLVTIRNDPSYMVCDPLFLVSNSLRCVGKSRANLLQKRRMEKQERQNCRSRLSAGKQG